MRLPRSHTLSPQKTLWILFFSGAALKLLKWSDYGLIHGERGKRLSWNANCQTWNFWSNACDLISGVSHSYKMRYLLFFVDSHLSFWHKCTVYSSIVHRLSQPHFGTDLWKEGVWKGGVGLNKFSLIYWKQCTIPVILHIHFLLTNVSGIH